MPKSFVASGDQWVFYDAQFKSTYTQAREKCSDMGAKLVDKELVDQVRFWCRINCFPSITRLWLQVLSWTLIKKPEFKEFWIGLRDTDKEGTWKWESGETLQLGNSWNWWKHGEPNNKENEDCVAAGKNENYHDGVSVISCDERRPVLCLKSKL